MLGVRITGMGLTPWFWVLRWDLGGVDALRIRCVNMMAHWHFYSLLLMMLGDVLVLWCGGKRNRHGAASG